MHIFFRFMLLLLSLSFLSSCYSVQPHLDTHQWQNNIKRSNLDIQDILLSNQHQKAFKAPFVEHIYGIDFAHELEHYLNYKFRPNRSANKSLRLVINEAWIKEEVLNQSNRFRLNDIKRMSSHLVVTFELVTPDNKIIPEADFSITADSFREFRDDLSLTERENLAEQLVQDLIRIIDTKYDLEGTSYIR